MTTASVPWRTATGTRAAAVITTAARSFSTCKKNPAGKIRIACTDKFGKPVPIPGGTESCDFSKEVAADVSPRTLNENKDQRRLTSAAAFEWMRDQLSIWTFDEFRSACRQMVDAAKDPARTAAAIEVLTLLNDRRYSTGAKRRSHLLQVVHTELNRLFGSLPNIGVKDAAKGPYRLIDFATRGNLRAPLENEKTLVIDAANFAPEGANCDAELLVDAFMKGWRRFISFNCIGQRYIGCGLGPETDDVVIDVYGSSGDYLGSGH